MRRLQKKSRGVLSDPQLADLIEDLRRRLSKLEREQSVESRDELIASRLAAARGNLANRAGLAATFADGFPATPEADIYLGALVALRRSDAKSILTEHDHRALRSQAEIDGAREDMRSALANAEDEQKRRALESRRVELRRELAALAGGGETSENAA